MTTFRFDPDDDSSTASLGDIENYFQENGSQADRLPNSGDTVESHHTGAVTGNISVDRWTNGIDLLSGSFTASFADTVVASGGASVDVDSVEDLFLSGSASAEIGSAITVNLRGGATATVGSIDFNRFGVATTFGAVVVLEGSSLICPSIESSSDVGLETVVEGTLETGAYEGGIGIISRLTILNGGSMTVSTFGLGSQAEDEETLQIVGSGSSLSYGGALVIGNAGDGQLLIRDGASQTFTSIVVAKQASSGNQAVSSVLNGINVQGAGSKLGVANSLSVGQRGDGHLSLFDGAQVTVGAALRLADAAGSEGTASIGNSFTGAGRSMLIVNGDLTGGSGASGIFLDSGGSLDVKGNIQLGIGGTATGSSGVRDTGSKIASGGDFLLGVGGKHALGLQGGASVEVAGDFVLGSGANGEGTLTVSTGLGKTPDAPIAVKADVMQVGGLGTGTLNVFAGIQLKMTGTDVWVGAKAGSSGTVSIAGKDANGRAASVSTDTLIVGALGEGELNVLNGAVLRSTSGLIGEQDTGKGTALVTGVDSLWVSRKGFSVGDEGEGSLKIELGGKAQITKGDLAVGRLAESSGEVVVDGKGSLLALGEALVAIGNEGEGKLTISNGGKVQLTTVEGSAKGPMQIGFEAGSSGSVLLTGKGSSLQVGGAGEVVVANAGEGALSLANGARLEVASIDAALSQGSNGTVTVRGKGSLLEADSFHFTGEGAADLDILGWWFQF